MGTTPKNRTITLKVKAKDLFGLRGYPPTEGQIDDNTYLIDDEGLESRYGAANKDYLTLVYMDKDITWSIALNDPKGEDLGYGVRLDYVRHTPNPGNPNFFDKEILNVDIDTGKITGRISRDPDLENKDDSYTINFIVENIRTSKEFVLDPKLQIRKKN